MKQDQILCVPCNVPMEYLQTSDDLSGDLFELYECPKCKHRINVKVAGVED